MEINDLHPFMQRIIKECKCCITDKPLYNCTNLNMVQLPYRATWRFPVWGKISDPKIQNLAVAYIHDDCMDEEGRISGRVKYAIEIRDNHIKGQDIAVYHPLTSLEPCKELAHIMKFGETNPN